MVSSFDASFIIYEAESPLSLAGETVGSAADRSGLAVRKNNLRCRVTRNGDVHLKGSTALGPVYRDNTVWGLVRGLRGGHPVGFVH